MLGEEELAPSIVRSWLLSHECKIKTASASHHIRRPKVYSHLQQKEDELLSLGRDGSEKRSAPAL